MATNRMSFGEHLRQFALSVDFIDPGHYDLIQHQIKTYLYRQLEATQVALFERTRIDEKDGLTTVWSYPNFRIHQTLRDENGEYRRQLAMAIGDQRNLWVISERGRLNFKNSGIDVWGDKEDEKLPPFYVARNAQPSQTAIVLLTKNAQGQVNGAFLVEMQRVVRPSKVLRREMRLIADAIGLLHATDVATQEQREGTTRAINNLADLVSRLELDTGPRPLMFVASSSRAPSDVMEAIDEVLGCFANHVYVEPWQQMHRPGNINMQLVENIRRAQYGVCYMSEPTAESGSTGRTGNYSFADNPNVLVEAGMLHIVTSSDSVSGTGWIPIREKDSPDVPFDLGNQRMIFVERDDDGQANIEKFKQDLKDKIAALVGAEPAEESEQEDP